MKDMDFDELDKAVNSLMSRTKKDTSENKSDSAQVPAVSPNADPAQNAPSINEPDMPTTAAPISPGTVKPKSAPATNPDTQPAVKPQPAATSPSTNMSSAPSRPATPAARRGGKFMDVVPKKSPSMQPSSAPSREGVAISPQPGADINPTSSGPAKSSAPPQPVAPTPQPKPAAAEQTTSRTDWPDPIEVSNKKSLDSEKSTQEEKPQAEELQQQPPKKEEKDQPLNSPFLSDAKVEKRPLGGVAPAASSEAEPFDSMPSEADAQLPAKPSDVNPETPEEFGGDVMKVEADTHMGLPKTDDLASDISNGMSSGRAAGVITPSKPEPELPEEIEPRESLQENSVSSSEPKISERSTASKLAPASRISIPPQYKEQPSTGEQESGAIYDTSTYHQPLAHPAKKKSGWLWVLWIVLILIVGAGAGAALYFLGVM